GVERVGLGERRFAVLGDADLVALHAQRALQRLGDFSVVLDHENPGWPRVVVHLEQRVRRGGVEASRVMAKRRRNTRARRSSGWSLSSHLPTLSQRQMDLIGLGLIGLGVFLATVLYFHWAGGKVGTGLTDGLRFAFGAVAYVVPVAVLAAGIILVLRPV